MGLTGPDQHHAGLPSYLSPGAGPHFSSARGLQFVLELCCKCAGLQRWCSSGWTSLTHTADLSPAPSPGWGPWTHVVPLSPALPLVLPSRWTSLTHLIAVSPASPLAPSHFAPDLSPWMDSSPGLLLAMSGAVKGPCYQSPAVCHVQVPQDCTWSVRAWPVLGLP